MRIKKLSIGLLGGAAILATLAFTTVKASKDQAKHPVEFDSALVMTPQVSAIVTRACADCHSMTPHLPWYANVPPASWMIQQDIVKARKAVNLTTWSQQNGKTADSAIGSVAHRVHAVRDRASPALNRLLAPVDSLAARTQAAPLKSLLLAAALGATLMAVVGVVRASRRR